MQANRNAINVSNMLNLLLMLPANRFVFSIFRLFLRGFNNLVIHTYYIPLSANLPPGKN